MKKCYKIVRKLENGERVSCITPNESGLRETYITSYNQVEIVPVGFVFKDLYDAKDWCRTWLIDPYYNHHSPLRSGERFEIWECQVSSMCMATVLSLPDLFTKGFGYMKEWVRNVKKQKLNIYEFVIRYENAILIKGQLTGCGPIGGYLARNVKLVKQVS